MEPFDDIPFPSEEDFSTPEEPDIKPPVNKSAAKESTCSLLDKLAQLESSVLDLELEKTRSISAIIPDPLRKQLQAIEDEYDLKFQTIKIELETTEATIRAMAIFANETVKGGSGYRAEYSAGKISWDTKGLLGFAVAHKEVLAFRKEGKPFISIKRPK